MITCKLADGAATCPRNLNICCGSCESFQTCDMACGTPLVKDPKDCPDAEAVTDELTTFQSAVPDVIDKISTLTMMKKQLDEQEKILKQKLVEAMEAYGVKSFETEEIKLVYVAPTTRTTIDSTRLKKDHPDLAEQYTKTSNVSASVRVTVK